MADTKQEKRKPRQDSRNQEPDLMEKVIRIDRVNKVVKGGKRLAFRAFIIAGDQEGKVGYGLGKSKEVPVAIKKAVERAKKYQVGVNIINGTIPHDIIGVYGASRVLLKPAKPGTGVIAGGAIRILLEALGLRNIIAKSLGSRNSINATKAALNGLLNLRNLKEEEEARGRKLPVYFKTDAEMEEELAAVKKMREQKREKEERERAERDAKRQKRSKRGPKKYEKNDDRTSSTARKTDETKSVKTDAVKPAPKVESAPKAESKETASTEAAPKKAVEKKVEAPKPTVSKPVEAKEEAKAKVEKKAAKPKAKKEDTAPEKATDKKEGSKS